MNAIDEGRGNPFRRRHEADDPLGATNETPVDPAAVQADDALLDLLGASSPDGFDAWLEDANAALIAEAAGHYEVEAELVRVKLAALCGRPLVAWRHDVGTEPIGAELVDTDTALAAISAGRKPAARRHPVLGPVAAAAAVLVIAFSVLGLLSLHADPGEWLWPLHEFFYPMDGE